MSELPNPRDCPRAIKSVFEKLCSWQEESQNQFSDIINTHRGKIVEGINDLVGEVNELKGHFPPN